MKINSTPSRSYSQTFTSMPINVLKRTNWHKYILEGSWVGDESWFLFYFILFGSKVEVIFLLCYLWHFVYTVTCKCRVSKIVVQWLSQVQFFATPLGGSIPSSSVLYHLPEFAQTHAHWVGDAIQPSHLLLPAFPPALNRSQSQDLFQWVHSSHHMATVLEFQLHQISQHLCTNWITNIKILYVH